jgi:nucleoside-diphosphate-sugar epimerase
MRIFLTGANGYLGGAVLDAFVRAGHAVTALAPHKERGAALAARGATSVIGEIGAAGTWRDAAAGYDAWIHVSIELAPGALESDATAIDTILAAADAANGDAPRVFVYTSSIWVLGAATSPVDETAPTDAPAVIAAWRVAHEQRVLAAATPSLRTAVIRPGIVYGGARGIVGDVFKDGANALIRLVGDGTNRWPLVYERDAAELYVRVATTPGASGIFHATDEGDERVIDIVEVIARHSKTGADVRRIPLDEARAKMGPYADALALDQVVRSTRSRALGWSPTLRSVAGNVPRLYEEWRRGQDG